jgi:hypothetical protein
LHSIQGIEMSIQRHRNDPCQDTPIVPASCSFEKHMLHGLSPAATGTYIKVVLLEVVLLRLVHLDAYVA